MTGSAVLFRTLLASAGVAVVVTATVVAIRPRSGVLAARDGLRQPSTPPAHKPADDVVLLGWARPISGYRGKHRASYVHEIELEDGRKVHYRSEDLFGGVQCVKVRGRQSGETFIVRHVEIADEPCPERARQPR
jgi:hypothetical protein